MIEFYVSGQSLKFFTPVVAADSLNYLTAKVNFNEEWNGYSKWLHFRQGEDLSATVYDISLDENDEVTANDALNLGIGEWEIYVTGTKDSSRLTTETVILTVKESGLIDAPLHGLPMSAAEQVDFKANQALLVAMSVKEAAENGAFDGKSFAVKGFYASLDDLLSSVTPEIGDSYGIGAEAPYDIYTWDSVNSMWVNIGAIQGAKGDDGAQGVTFTPIVDSNGNISWTNDGGLENPVVRNIRGPKGEAGAQGADGKSPYQIASENGYTGTETTFNNSLTAFPYHNARHLPDGADPITVKTGNIEDSAVTAAKLATGAIPEKLTISLSDTWAGDASPYTQSITISGYTVTLNSKVDLQPSAEVLAQLINDGVLALYIANDDGTLTAVTVGEKPSAAMTIQATIEEVR